MPTRWTAVLRSFRLRYGSPSRCTSQALALRGEVKVTLIFRGFRSLISRIVVLLVVAAAAPAIAGTVQATAATLAVDVQVTTHQSSAAASITSPTFTTHQANEVLVAFLTSDGPNAAA